MGDWGNEEDMGEVGIFFGTWIGSILIVGSSVVGFAPRSPNVVFGADGEDTGCVVTGGVGAGTGDEEVGGFVFTVP